MQLSQHSECTPFLSTPNTSAVKSQHTATVGDSASQLPNKTLISTVDSKTEEAKKKIVSI